MNGELVPAAVAAAGGTALAAGIYVHERRREQAMRDSRVRLGLRFPLGLDPKAAQAALGALSGLPDPAELVAETMAEAGQVRHAVLLPSEVRESASAVLASAMPGLRLTETAAAGPRGPGRPLLSADAGLPVT